MKVAWIGEGGKCRGEYEDEIPPEFVKYIDDNAEDIAQEIEFRAQATAAFIDKTGRLRKSIKARKSKYEGGGWIVGAWSPHAWLVEFGHELIDWYSGRKVGHVPEHKFLRTALNNVISTARAKFGTR